MKKFFKFVGMLCTLIVFLVLVLGLYSYFEYRSGGEKIEKETQHLAESAINDVTANWNPDELEKRAHPLLMDLVHKQNQTVGEFFNIYRKLGAPKGEPKCKLVNFRSNIGVPTFTLADYSCAMEFVNASGVIYLELLNDKDSKDSYLLTAFKIDSPLFTNLLLKK